MKITSKQLQDLASKSKTCFDGGNHLFWQNLADKVSEFFNAPEGDFETEEQTSKEYRQKKILESITNRDSLPVYARYGNAMGSVYFRFFSTNGWVHADIDFYEIIEAVAKRAPK